MTPLGLCVLLSALQLKHLAADYLLQTEAMLRCKGIYGNLTGAAHSAMHGAFTLLALLLFGPFPPVMAALISFLEFLAHYHTDWAKDQVNRRAGYQPHQKGYWVLIGIDQFLHQMTYVVIIYVAITYG